MRFNDKKSDYYTLNNEFTIGSFLLVRSSIRLSIIRGYTHSSIKAWLVRVVTLYERPAAEVDSYEKSHPSTITLQPRLLIFLIRGT